MFYNCQRKHWFFLQLGLASLGSKYNGQSNIPHVYNVTGWRKFTFNINNTRIFTNTNSVCSYMQLTMSSIDGVTYTLLRLHRDIRRIGLNCLCLKPLGAPGLITTSTNRNLNTGDVYLVETFILIYPAGDLPHIKKIFWHLIFM